MIPYGRQDISQADIDAVVEVLRGPFLTQGPAVPAFEAALSARVGGTRGVAMNSATSALHVSCMALGLGPGDILWTVSNSFVASANCARYCGADVDFVDIDARSWNMSVPRLREKLEVARKSKRLPKIVVPVHFSGQPTEQEAIADLAKEFGFKVIEDASHSVGASRNGEPVGSCRWSDITVFSFHPVKIITSGEGGMAMTKDPELAERMVMLRSHGITRNANRFVGTGAAGYDDAWYYEQQMLGFNYRMTDIHAVLGQSQVERLEANVTRRNALARRYDVALKDLPLQLPTLLPGNRSAFHLYVVRLTHSDANRRRSVFNALRGKGVGVNVHYLPIHLQPYYRALGFTYGQFPESERYGATAITIPLYAALEDSQQDQVVRALQDSL